MKALLYYHPESGDFVWVVRTSNRVSVGNQAGTVDGKGYLQIRIDGYFYRAHRLAFLYMLGRWPDPQGEHRDLDRLNNCWGNLREATAAQNAVNVRKRITNTTGYKGIYFNKRKQKYCPRMNHQGKRKYLGEWDNLDDAISAYVQGLMVYHGAFARAT